MLSYYSDAKKHKALINSFKIMMPRVNIRRYQQAQDYGDKLVMFEMRCQALHKRCNEELTVSNLAQKKY